jgi:hypothetical protein
VGDWAQLTRLPWRRAARAATRVALGCAGWWRPGGCLAQCVCFGGAGACAPTRRLPLRVRLRLQAGRRLPWVLLTDDGIWGFPLLQQLLAVCQQPVRLGPAVLQAGASGQPTSPTQRARLAVVQVAGMHTLAPPARVLCRLLAGRGTGCSSADATVPPGSRPGGHACCASRGEAGWGSPRAGWTRTLL